MDESENKMKNIDWTTYPCETCSLYHEADNCVCGKLDEWSEQQKRNKKLAMEELNEKIELHSKNHPDGSEKQLETLEEIRDNRDFDEISDAVFSATKKSLYENISYIREFAEMMKDCKVFNKELADALMSVATYADICYISDAENIGRDIIENAAVIEEKSYNKGYDDAANNALKWFADSYGYFLDTHHNTFDSDEFLKSMEEKKNEDKN